MSKQLQTSLIGQTATITMGMDPVYLQQYLQLNQNTIQQGPAWIHLGEDAEIVTVFAEGRDSILTLKTKSNTLVDLSTSCVRIKEKAS